MDHVVDMARGVPQSFYVDQFAREGIMFEGIAGPPAYVAMSLPLSQLFFTNDSISPGPA